MVKFRDIIKLPDNRGYKVIYAWKPYIITKTRKQAEEKLEELDRRGIHNIKITKKTKPFGLKV